MNTKLGWVALLVAVLALAVNVVALNTISQQQVTIRGLQAQIAGLVEVAAVSADMDQATADALDNLNRMDVNVLAILDTHTQTINSLVQNDVAVNGVLEQLVTLAEH